MIELLLGLLGIGLILYFLPFVLGALIIYGIYRLILHIRKIIYFRSDEFLEHKSKVDSMVAEYNEISDYVESIPNENRFVPEQKINKNSDLVKYENTSKHNYKRDRNVRSKDKDNVYAASLQVVKRASEEPIKYLCKYFNIEPKDENLNQLEEIGTNISRMENTIENLKLREKQIEDDFNPPKYILKYYQKELMEKIGVKIPSIEPEYSEYIFEYVSPGGNSSQRAIITFDGDTVEAVSEYIAERIKYRKSAKGQRALMTKAYRTKIKERDNYTCQMCGVSTADQSLLLLEVDHIIPISKGGKSTDDNLQTLCWKCNRTKSDKILT